MFVLLTPRPTSTHAGQCGRSQLPSQPACYLHRRSAPHIRLGASLTAPLEAVAVDHKPDLCDPTFMRIGARSNDTQPIAAVTFLFECAERLACACAVVVNHGWNEVGWTAPARARVHGPCASDRRARYGFGCRYGLRRFELRDLRNKSLGARRLRLLFGLARRHGLVLPSVDGLKRGMRRG